VDATEQSLVIYGLLDRRGAETQRSPERRISHLLLDDPEANDQSFTFQAKGLDS